MIQDGMGQMVVDMQTWTGCMVDANDGNDNIHYAVPQDNLIC